MWTEYTGSTIDEENLKTIVSDRKKLLFVGTDSHSFGNYWLFATVICCYVPGNGGRFFTKKKRVPKEQIKTLIDRLLHEAHLSIEAAQEVENLCDRKPAIHVDIATKDSLSSKFHSNVTSYVLGMGYEVATKPNAWASSCVADRQAR
jgi:predicted RNase H-related nuclease YkuK (DUF458 family)